MNEQEPHTFTPEEGCLQCLEYFGIFQYPLTSEEVHRYNVCQAELSLIERTLDELCAQGKAYRYGRYYLPVDEPTWVPRREEGNARARELLAMTPRYVNIVASFPFVRGIAISGSLSKFYADRSPDIDYFIITAPYRLWIARSFLHLFKKLTFLTGHQHYFCMNYFIDTLAMDMTHRNQYAAIEVMTLLPVYNDALVHAFCQANNWTSTYLPNHPKICNREYLVRSRVRPCKSLAEFFLNLLFPKAFNRFLMNITDRKWRNKWRHSGYTEEEYQRAFQTEVHISKNHPADYEKKVLDALSEQEVER